MPRGHGVHSGSDDLEDGILKGALPGGAEKGEAWMEQAQAMLADFPDGECGLGLAELMLPSKRSPQLHELQRQRQE